MAHCETGSEDHDTDRFIRDCEAFLGVEVIRLKSDEFADTWAVWTKRRYLAGVAGAPCTSELKIGPRLAFQKPDDIHVFGYTADGSDQRRADNFHKNYPETTMVTPLIERGVTKAGCRVLLADLGIREPRLYAMGFANANCIPCVKATAPGYWALIRREFPAEFARMAALSREIGARLLEIHKERLFIDELPADWPCRDADVPACDFLCHLAGQAA